MRWKLRIGVLVLVLAGALILTRDVWMARIGQSLVCARDTAPSDAILIENFDPDYVLFERAAALTQAKIAPRIVVPVQALPSGAPNLVSTGIVEVMARYARIPAWETVPFSETEPISLNAALTVRRYLIRIGVKSVIVVAPALRSRRSALVYRTVLGETGIHVRCEPVVGRIVPERWTETWHGFQVVGEESVKLSYYRFYVLRFR